MDQLIGPSEVAALLGVQRATVMQWVYRGAIVVPSSTVDGRPAWTRNAVLAWAKETGRLRV